MRFILITIVALCATIPAVAGDAEEEALAQLRSEDEATALAAALRLDPHRLTLAEMRRQAEVLARHPDRVFLPRGARQDVSFIPADCFGAVDLPAVFAAAAKMETEPDSASFFDLHRTITSDQLPALVEAMAHSKPAAQGHLIRLLDSLVRSSDAHREAVLRGLLWVQALVDAEEAGEKPPALEEISFLIPSVGLPAAFMRLVERAWRAGDERRYLQNWLRRWSFTLTPLPKDLPFLVTQVDWMEWLPNRSAMVRLIGKLESAEARAFLAKLAERTDDEIVIPAAAELARDGKPGRLLALLRSEEHGHHALLLAFEVLPEFAVRRWLAQLQAGDPDRPAPVLDGEERDELESWYGVRIPEAVLDRMAAAVLAADPPLPKYDLFFSWQHPDALTGPALDRLAEKLLAFDGFDEEYFYPEGYGRALAFLELRAPEKLAPILAVWKPQLTVEKYLEMIGRNTLFNHLFRPDPDSMAARAEAAGQPWGVVDLLSGAEWGDTSEEVVAEMTALCEDGDWIGAALRFVEHQPRFARGLVGIDDPRVHPLLVRLRDERKNRWDVVAALALRGEPAAREEWMGLVRDCRMQILYEQSCGLATLRGEPELVELWIDRLESTCCVSNHAHYALTETFPTLEFDDVPVTYPVHRRRAAAWYERHRGSLRWSRILGGLVPSR